MLSNNPSLSEAKIQPHTVNYILCFPSVFTSCCMFFSLFFLQSELPLVGNLAPDFEAEAVFDQEFIKVHYLDEYAEVSNRIKILAH